MPMSTVNMDHPTPVVMPSGNACGNGKIMLDKILKNLLIAQ